MKIDFSHMRSHARDDRPWHGAALVVEALVLLAFIVASLAIITQLLAGAHQRAADAAELSNAAILAANDAEAFAANPAESSQRKFYRDDASGLMPAELQGENENDLYEVERTVSRERSADGFLLHAHITVTRNGDQVYELDTARYVSNKEAAL